MGRVQPFLLFTVSLSHFFNSGWNASLPGARGFFHWNSCLEVFDKKQKHLWIHKSNSPFESKGNSVLFLRFLFLGKVESQRNCSIPKRVKKELAVFLVQHIYTHPPKKIQQKNQIISLFCQKPVDPWIRLPPRSGWCCGSRQVLPFLPPVAPSSVPRMTISLRSMRMEVVQGVCVKHQGELLIFKHT